jgi:hypothetical protein
MRGSASSVLLDMLEAGWACKYTISSCRSRRDGHAPRARELELVCYHPHAHLILSDRVLYCPALYMLPTCSAPNSKQHGVPHQTR